MTNSCKAVLFDLGNTLAAYYRPVQFGPILTQSIHGVLAELQRKGIESPSFDTALAAAQNQNREAGDFRFVPMQRRLARIFDLGGRIDEALLNDLCSRFLDPIFAVGKIYDDTIPVLTALRDQGYVTAVISNAPWGSPPRLWHSKLAEIVMCGDVGWRKPAPQIFHHAVERLGLRCEDCVFVGDELQWDVEGSAAVGMRPVLIDREDLHPGHPGPRIRNLWELEALL
jgi:putative hydrolase of the HAD superfamily